jgi:hypothetical protein
MCRLVLQGHGTIDSEATVGDGCNGQHAAVVLACSIVSSSCLLSTDANSTSPPGQRHMKWGILHLPSSVEPQLPPVAGIGCSNNSA